MQTYADLNGSIVIEEAAPLPPPFQELPDDVWSAHLRTVGKVAVLPGGEPVEEAGLVAEGASTAVSTAQS